MQRHSRTIKVFENETEHKDFIKWLNASSTESQQVQRIFSVARNEQRRSKRNIKKVHLSKVSEQKMMEIRGTRYENNSDNVNTKTSH